MKSRSPKVMLQPHQTDMVQALQPDEFEDQVHATTSLASFRKPTTSTWNRPTIPFPAPKLSSAFLGRRTSRKLDDEAQARFVYDPDPWRHARIQWLSVLINLGTYVLLMSDVMRAGTITHLNMRHLSRDLYSYFGSFAYEVLTVARDSVDLTNITATRHGHPVDQARIWSYTFDTTSLEIRTITSRFNASESRALSCMNYQVRCDVAGTFSIPETFCLLDQVVDGVASIPESMVPAIYPPSKDHQSQIVRLAIHMKSREVFILYDLLIVWFLNSIKMRSSRFSYWPRVDATFDVCADPRDRPYLCDASTISDYRFSADPNDPESASVTFIWASMNDLVRATYQEFHNVSDNVSIDVAIMEGYTQPTTYIGGWVMTVSMEFEVVILIRVRDCSRESSGADGDSCRTIRVIDYRYEGGRILTDVDDWNHCVLILRVFSQAYYIGRLIGLALGCYYAFPHNNRSLGRAVFMFFSEVPSHVVAYGSCLPIVMYTLASWIDGPIVNAIIHGGGLGLQGSFMKSPGVVYTLICLLMRKQWLMAFLTMVWIRLQVCSPMFNRYQGISSIRGHVFGVLASMSMVVGLYHPNFRDTRFLGLNLDNPDISVANARLTPRDFSNRRLGGVYSDLLSIGLSAVLYVLVVLVLRIVRHVVCQAFVVRIQQESIAKNHPKPKARAFYTITRENFFFCQTDMLPSTCHTLWNVEGLTCGWVDDIVVSMAGRPHEDNLLERTRRAMLMNIVQLTEPMNFVCLWLGLNSQKVYTYAETDTRRTFTVVNELSFDPVYWKEIKSKKLEVVATKPARDVPFHELVRCR